MNCPCCGAIPGQAHDDDCRLVAYLTKSTGAYVIDSQGLAVPLPPGIVREGVKVQPCVTIGEPGYELLADVLARAFDQAARGKGRERHSQGEPFQDQVMQDGARRFGTGALLFQAFKKSEESQRLPTDRAVAEMLGAIVYLAGAVIAREREEAERQARLAE